MNLLKLNDPKMGTPEGLYKCLTEPFLYRTFYSKNAYKHTWVYDLAYTWVLDSTVLANTIEHNNKFK